ncbi:YagE family [Aspergillus sp. HF37]|nr:YagE family [Aspergillus sp. HF37]
MAWTGSLDGAAPLRLGARHVIVTKSALASRCSTSLHLHHLQQPVHDCNGFSTELYGDLLISFEQCTYFYHVYQTIRSFDLPKFTCTGALRQPRNQCPFGLPRRKNFFSSDSRVLQKHSKNEGTEESPPEPQAQRRRGGRNPAAPTSLRRVAVEAQRSRDGFLTEAQLRERGLYQTKTVTAYAAAERFDIRKVRDILQHKGYEPDPFNTGLYPQVVHIQVPIESIRRVSSPSVAGLSPDEVGDVFVFPSGTVVAWSLPEGFTSFLATRTLLPAAEGAHVDELETEDLEFMEDPQREVSSIKGDTIFFGTKAAGSNTEDQTATLQTVDAVLTKVAFSSGLARSTKLAVLESLLANYFESTRTIPTLLSKGSRLPYTRDFILRKTGQLLSVRAQLNLYSELTDSLPDIFWDSRHELGLEGYYEQVGRALDVGIRIKLLNEKMDYAQEIASVLRERLSEKHGLRLEWIIILLIAVEVSFEVLRLWKERVHERGERQKLAQP